MPRRKSQQPNGGTAVREAPPKARFHIPDAPKWYANLGKAVVVRHASEHRPVAVLEILLCSSVPTQLVLTISLQEISVTFLAFGSKPKLFLRASSLSGTR